MSVAKLRIGMKPQDLGAHGSRLSGRHDQMLWHSQQKVL